MHTLDEYLSAFPTKTFSMCASKSFVVLANKIIFLQIRKIMIKITKIYIYDFTNKL